MKERERELRLDFGGGSGRVLGAQPWAEMHVESVFCRPAGRSWVYLTVLTG